jgi:hypothetical protein
MPDTIDWINNYYGVSLDEEELRPILFFSLLWNVFESVACNSNANIQTIVKKVNEEHQRLPFNQGNYSESLDYFRSRYIKDGQPTASFRSFSFERNEDWKSRVANVLISNRTETSELITALLVIVYRYRNNLFHGVKDIPTIEGQKTNFENANKVLKQFLTDLKDRG